jgi:Ca-activated chloride channel homolog
VAIAAQSTSPLEPEVLLEETDGPAVDFSEALAAAEAEPPWLSMEPNSERTAGLSPPRGYVPGMGGKPDPSSARPDPTVEWVTGRFGSGVPDPFLDALWFRWGPVFGAHGGFDELPELDKVVGLRPRGIDPPLVPGFDWASYRLTGVFPFASPASPGLRRSVVPLDVRRSSYELLQRYLRDGMLPPPGALRTEELLAAIDYGFAKPTDAALGLHIAAGPSVFGHWKGLGLLQVAVQAQTVAPVERQAGHLVLAIDCSTSMRWGGRLDQVRQAILELVDQIEPGDRLSLVAFREEPRIVAEGMGRDDRPLLEQLVAEFQPKGSTNLGEGLRAAYVVAEQAGFSQDELCRVILLTDGLGELDTAATERLRGRLTEAARNGIGLEVVDLAQENVGSPQLAALAQAGGGAVRRAASAEEIGWAVQEILTGQSQRVASEVRLEVRWNPAAVVAYRLLGHEANPAADLMPAHPEAEFFSEQSATALYEVRFQPKGADEVAVAELSWRDPRNGKPHRVVRSVRRGQFGGTLLEAPLSLQAAAIAAEAAEVLRESPFARFSNGAVSSLPLVVEAGRRLDTRLYQNETYVEFLATLEIACQAHPYRRPGGGRTGARLK